VFIVRTVRNTHIQFVPHRKHVTSPLQSLSCLEKQSLFIVRTIRNTQIHFQIIYKNPVRTSRETHYVSATKPSRLMLFRETFARTIQNTQIHFQIIYNNPVRTSQETHYVSATKLTRLMLFGETVALYCENHTEHTNTMYGRMQSFIMVKNMVHMSTVALRGTRNKQELFR
jgi:hypothetical protein